MRPAASIYVWLIAWLILAWSSGRLGLWVASSPVLLTAHITRTTTDQPNQPNSWNAYIKFEMRQQEPQRARQVLNPVVIWFDISLCVRVFGNHPPYPPIPTRRLNHANPTPSQNQPSDLRAVRGLPPHAAGLPQVRQVGGEADPGACICVRAYVCTCACLSVCA